MRLVTGPDLAMEEDGVTIARWAYGDIRRADGDGRLRLRCLSGPPLARLEIADEALAASLLARLPASGRDAGRGHGRARQIVGWSLAACVSILALVLYGIPFAAGRLAPLVPLSVEQRLGDATDTRLRAMLGGRVCTRPDGAAALARMVEALGTAGGIARPVEVLVLSSPVANAVTLPGGRIYVFDGLLRKAETPDELAGLIAHEMGHVHNRDGLRTVIRAGGTSFLIGLLFGDVTGGAAIIFAANALLDAAQSRDAERVADDFAAATVTALGRPPAAFGDLLVRITGSDSRGRSLTATRSVSNGSTGWQRRPAPPRRCHQDRPFWMMPAGRPCGRSAPMPPPALILAPMAPKARSGGRTSRTGPEAAATGSSQPGCDRFWFVFTNLINPE
ncbi:M48 family metallopeptidase [Tistrella bauzanensis]